MSQEYEIQRCTRRCAATGRELAPGEVFYSLLVEESDQWVRRDYCQEAWRSAPWGDTPPVGWWRSRMPTPQTRQFQLAPNEVLLQLLEDLESQPDKVALRYVLALLLVRRRLLTLAPRESTANVEASSAEMEHLTLRGAGRDDIQVFVPAIDASEVDALQDELVTLLYADAA